MKIYRLLRMDAKGYLSETPKTEEKHSCAKKGGFYERELSKSK